MKKGFTVIELLVVLAILAVLMVVITPSFMRFRQQQALQNTTNGVLSLITSARTKTLSGNDNSIYSVRFESSRAILFKGIVYTDGMATNEIYGYESPVTLGTVLLQDATQVLTFDRLRGTTSQHGTIQLQLPNGTTRMITVTQTGSAERQ